MRSYRELVERRVGEAEGTIVDFAGDSFMAVFPRVAEAMGAAIEIATEVENRNSGNPEHRRLVFRMGLDLGEVVIADGQYFGDALNIASRIQALARPGGINVTGRVYTALDEPALRFSAIGRKNLKNIPEGVEVFEFADLPSSGSDYLTRVGVALESPTVAILPIHTGGLDDSLLAVADTVRADLIHRLARNPNLTVVDAKEAKSGERAGGRARYMIETGMNQVGDRVRIYANLFDVVSMNIVKSHKWTGHGDDLFEASERLADAMGTDIEVDLIVGAPAGLYAALDDPKAIEHIQLGWFHLNNGNPDGWARAVDHFSELIDAHPDEPYGFVLLAFSMWIGAANGFAADPEKAFDEALSLARSGAERVDPTGMARMVEAAVLMSRGDSEGAAAAIEDVQIERPTCDTTFGLEGSVRRYLGQWDRAADLEDQAMRLAGANKLWYPTVKSACLFMGGRVEQAMSMAQMVVEQQPNNLEALLFLAAAQARLGLDRRAGATADRIREHFPDLDVGEWIDQNPYQTPESVARWKDDLVAAGVLESN